MVVSCFLDIGVDGPWRVVGTLLVADDRGIGADDGDDDTMEVRDGLGAEEGVERMLPCRPLVHKDRVADGHHSILVAAVVLRPVGEEDMRRLPYLDGMDSAGSEVDTRNAAAESILAAPGWTKKVVCA